jgi:hypothetical protein
MGAAQSCGFIPQSDGILPRCSASVNILEKPIEKQESPV